VKFDVAAGRFGRAMQTDVGPMGVGMPGDAKRGVGRVAVIRAQNDSAGVVLVRCGETAWRGILTGDCQYRGADIR
jgi:hypothetical protein